MAGDVGRRSLVALVGIPLAIGIFRLGGWTMGIALAAVAAGGARELYRMGGMAGSRVLRPAGIVSSAAVVLSAAHAGSWTGWAPVAFAVVIALAFAGLAAAINRPVAEARPLESAALTTLAPLYLGVPLGFAILLRAAASDPWLGAILVIYPIAVTWAGDSAAYFGGRRWGRRKLAPAVSPGKTVEGSIAGVLGSLAMGVLVVFITDRWIPGFPIGLGTALVLSFAIGIIGQVGDLAESALKRASGVKDSGDFLPGHGGILDRFDGVLFALPVTWLVLTWMGSIG